MQKNIGKSYFNKKELIIISFLETNTRYKLLIQLSILLVFPFFIIITQLIKKPDNSVLWIIILMYFILITRALIKYIKGNWILINGVLVITFCILYLTIGSLLIECRINAVDYKISQESEKITEIQYSFKHWNNSMVPLTFVKINLVGEEGLILNRISTESVNVNRYKTAVSFNLINEKIKFPTYTVVTYRFIEIVPIIIIKRNELDKSLSHSEILGK